MRRIPVLVWFVLFSCITLFAAGYLLATQIKAASAEQTTPAALLAVETATPRPEPSPTIDYAPTKTQQEIELYRAKSDLAAMDARIAETNRQIEQAKADAAQAVAMAAENEAKKAEQERLTAEAHNKQTELQIELQKQQNEQTRLQAQVQAAENQKTALMVDVKKAEAQGSYNWILGLGCAGLVGGMVYVGAVIDRRTRYQASLGAVAVPAPAPAVTHIHREQTSRRIPDPPGDVEKIRIWAIAALAGRSIAVDHWEADGTPFTGYREYRNGVYAWAARHHLIGSNTSREAVLNDDGQSVMTEWLIHHPSPTADFDPDNPLSQAVYTDAVNTEAVGEGEEGDDDTQS